MKKQVTNPKFATIKTNKNSDIVSTKIDYKNDNSSESSEEIKIDDSKKSEKKITSSNLYLIRMIKFFAIIAILMLTFNFSNNSCFMLKKSCDNNIYCEIYYRFCTQETLDTIFEYFLYDKPSNNVENLIQAFKKRKFGDIRPVDEDFH